MNWTMKIGETNYELWNIPEVFSNVHWNCSALSLNMGLMAAAFVCAAECKTVAEIGICNGFITQLLGRSLSASAGRDGLLVSCDNQVGGHVAGEMMLKASFVTCRYKVILADSRTVNWAAELEGRPLDLSVVDGDHSFEVAYADLCNLGTLTKSKGIILAHDYAGGNPGVVEAVDKFVSHGGWSKFSFPESATRGYAFAILQKE